MSNDGISCSPPVARCHRRGVTLIEVLVVVSLLSLISAAVVVAVVPMGTKAKIELTRKDAQSLRSAVLQWRIVGGEGCPTAEQLRKEQVIDEASKVDDPWGHPYKIACEGARVSVRSWGPDGKEGSEDDITVPPSKPESE